MIHEEAITVEFNGHSTRAHVFVCGQVQGGRFRRQTQCLARDLGLTGWVCNRWDGRIEAVFEGKEEVVHQAVDRYQAGSLSAQVISIDVDYEEPTGEFDSFRILSILGESGVNVEGTKKS